MGITLSQEMSKTPLPISPKGNGHINVHLNNILFGYEPNNLHQGMPIWKIQFKLPSHWMLGLPRTRFGIPKIPLEENILFVKPRSLKMRDVGYAGTLPLPNPNCAPF